MTVMDEIAAERAKQIARGYDASHDDEHKDESIVQAAVCYAIPHSLRGTMFPSTTFWQRVWPWALWHWDPKKPRREELITAAALIVAEVERLDRLWPAHIHDERQASSPLTSPHYRSEP